MYRKFTFMRPVDPDSGDGGGGTAEDRGDDFTPTDTDAATAAAALAAKEHEAAKAKADADAAELIAKEEEAKAKAAAAKTPVADADPEADPEPEPKPKDTRIPLARHEAILKKERDRAAVAETALAEARAGRATVTANEQIAAMEESITKLEAEYTKHIVDGEQEKAIAAMTKIRKTEREVGEARGDLKLQAATRQINENARYTVALERIEASYPVLNPEHADYDAAIEARVVRLKAGLQATGASPSEALQEAVQLVVGAVTAKQTAATTLDPTATEKDVAAARKKAAALKTAEALAKTPASTAKAGLDSDKLGGGKLDAKAVIGMSQKQFAALNEETLAQMRGDTL